MVKYPLAVGSTAVTSATSAATLVVAETVTSSVSPGPSVHWQSPLVSTSRLGKVATKGLTLIPLKLYLKGGKVKIELGLCRGKKLYDKRETEMRRIVDRETQAQLKERNR